MAEENTPEENNLEEEMMRLMAEETGGETDDAASADMMAALGEEDAGDGAGGAENIDDMLEQEMLKAMQSETGSSAGGLMSLASARPEMPADTPHDIKRLSDVDVNVTVELGGTSLAIKDIMEWTRNSIVELEPMEHDPVDVLVNGKLFARGEVVVVGDTFGVRIVELVDHPPNPFFKRS